MQNDQTKSPIELARDIIRKKPQLIWYSKNYDGFELSSIVEAVLNYGDWDDFKELIGAIGIEEVAKTFYEHAFRPRCNCKKEVLEFFDGFFKSQDTDELPDKSKGRDKDPMLTLVALKAQRFTDLSSSTHKKETLRGTNGEIWRTAVDVYFGLGKYSLGEVSKKAKELLGNYFSEKIFRIYLHNLKLPNTVEAISPVEPYTLSAKIIKERLRNHSTQI